jgi:hypothetical protein
MYRAGSKREGVRLGSGRQRDFDLSTDTADGCDDSGDDEDNYESDHFVEINERPVQRISMELFYKPHTISLLFVCIAGLTATAFVRDGSLSYQGRDSPIVKHYS